MGDVMWPNSAEDEARNVLHRLGIPDVGLFSPDQLTELTSLVVAGRADPKWYTGGDTVLQEIIIRLMIERDSGTEVFVAHFSDHHTGGRIGWIQGLGLMEAAKDDFRDQTFELGQYGRQHDSDD